MQPEIESWLKSITPSKGYYFAGFTDGEGSFNVSLRKRPDDSRLGWHVSLTFNVSQKESYILAQFKKLLGCGCLQYRNDGVTYFVVANPRSIIERVIPFFERFPFLSQTKQRNFAIFRKIAKLVVAGGHLQSDGFRRIVEIRESLNEGRGRKRKYEINDVFPPRKSSETIR